MTSNRKRFCTLIFAILLVLLSACAGKTGETSTQPTLPKDDKTVVEGKWEAFPLGDMNADNLPDTAYVYTAPYYETPFEGQPGEMEFAGCVNDTCYNRIKFSNGLPEIYMENTLWGTVEPIDDLDEDGVNELIFQKNWWIGIRSTIYIYSFNRKKEQWEILAHNWVYGLNSYKDRVTKIDKGEFKFNIEYMDTVVADWAKKDTLIGIRK